MTSNSSKPNIRVISSNPPKRQTTTSEWDSNKPTPNVKVLSDDGKVLSSLYEKRINDVPEAKEIHRLLKSTYRLVLVVIPIMIFSFIYEANYIREMSFIEQFNRVLSIYICIGASFQLHNAINNKPYDPFLMFTWIKKKAFAKISKKILAFRN
ncbi:hypothetical protein OTK49_03045 [Vibrio coralliirubri]|uniref:hypothetical protein n=1 Tax=Vibrio coralliirubri TaxID=1516159 RepID=UPI002284C66E|nr:hypothetical protein [Vibrio coralliirubri]MCY9861492.1 hypothetical protein [Vibrio coralliirubri]